jgi:hypothetical protein
MSEKVGIYDKYVISKRSGMIDPGAEYFVLRIDSDHHARIALKAYAESIRNDNPNLAFDLLAKIARHEGGLLKKIQDDRSIIGTDQRQESD